MIVRRTTISRPNVFGLYASLLVLSNVILITHGSFAPVRMTLFELLPRAVVDARAPRAIWERA